MSYIGISTTEVFKLMDVLNVNDAAALIVGASPADVEYNKKNDQYHLNRPNSNYVEDIRAAFIIARGSLIHAITVGRLKANIVPITHNKKLYKSDLQQDWIAKNGINSEDTVIDREGLKEWLENRGVYPPLLFPNGKKDNYMNINHPHYSPKLALCVKAWEIAQAANPEGETYKQFMLKWMVENAKVYGVKNTNPKEFDKLASISNWATKGGRTKSQVTSPLEKEYQKKEDSFAVSQELVSDLLDDTLLHVINGDDDDIPF